VATGLLRRSVAMHTANLRQSPLEQPSKDDLVQQKHKRFQVCEKWIYGDANNLGLIREIQHLIALYHGNNDETLNRIKKALEKYGVCENTAPDSILATYLEFFYEHFKINDIIQRNDEYTILGACKFLDNTHTKLKNAITPDTEGVAENDFTRKIKKMLQIALMRNRQIDHALSRLKTPEISDMADMLLLKDNTTTPSYRVFVNVEEEWTGINSLEDTGYS